MAQKLAIDFVLLPQKEVVQELVRLNNSLRRDYLNKRIVLNEKSCLPHLSLLMGVIYRDSIGEIKKKLNYLRREFMPIELEAIDLTLEDLPAEEKILKIIGLKIRETRKLRELHRKTVKDMSPHLIDSEISREMMYNPKEINSENTPWMFPYIRNFIKNSSYENFNPHLTIGDGILEQKVNSPMKFTATELSVAHIGNYCTCREIL